MAENKLADLSMDFVVIIWKITDGIILRDFALFRRFCFKLK